jgi:uncharacterized membrane protein YfcA
MDFRVFLIVGFFTLVGCAQLVRVIPEPTMMAVIGVPVTFFAALQLSGYQMSLSRRSVKIEGFAGAVAGALAGLSGIWGPPTVAYLTALNTPKHDQIRVQGVIFGLGSVALLFSHIGSGVLRAETIHFSLAMVPSAFVGMWAGMAVMERIDQKGFRRATLFVLLVAGLNLIRRAWFG